MFSFQTCIHEGSLEERGENAESANAVDTIRIEVFVLRKRSCTLCVGAAEFGQAKAELGLHPLEGGQSQTITPDVIWISGEMLIRDGHDVRSGWTPVKRASTTELFRAEDN